MRTITLIHPGLIDKRKGLKLAVDDPTQIKHLKVLRAGHSQYNYNYRIIDGNGLVAEAELLKLTKEGIWLELTSDVTQSGFGQVRYHAILPVVRATKVEQAVDQLTQLGIFSRINLYNPDFGRYKDGKLPPNKMKRLTRLVRSALVQSRGVVIPQIQTEDSLELSIAASQNLAEADPAFTGTYESILLAPHPDAETDFKAVAKTMQARINQLADTEVLNIYLIIGPEGGFSDPELEVLSNHKDAQLFKFDVNILTTETAAITFASITRAAELAA